jgi:CBS domain-containing protein
MQVYEAMTPDVVSVGPGATLMEAAQAMRNLDVGPLPVCEGERLVGMITDRDITIRATAMGQDPRTTQVRDVMTPEVVCCLETDEVSRVAQVMQEAQLRRLLVVSGEGRLVGIVSLGDLAVQTGDDKLAGETLERVSEPSVAQK